MMAPPSPEPNDRQPPRSGLKRDALSLLTGLALGVAALFLARPAHAVAMAAGATAAIAPSDSAAVRRHGLDPHYAPW